MSSIGADDRPSRSVRGQLDERPKGRRLDPIEAFEVIPWRALALFRLTTVAYAVILTVHNASRYPHPVAALVASGVMVGWSLLSIRGYEWARLRAWPLLLVDLAVTAGCVLVTLPIVGEALLARGANTLTVIWMACPVTAVAVIKGMRWGIAAALLIGGCDLVVRGGDITQTSVTATVIMVMAAAALGYLGNIGTRAQERLRQAAAVEAARSERDRLARDVHDSVLQVLALVQRRGEELGGAAAELGRLAGEQEVALRVLVGPNRGGTEPDGMADLRALIEPLASARLTVSAPATAVWLPAEVALEVTSAVAAAAENVRQHCPDARTWILLEDEGATVTVTVRDDGPGIPAGRLEQAAAQGRLGVAQSIHGRLADLGGTSAITSIPGQGTEVELTVTRRVPQPRRRRSGSAPAR